MASGVRRGWRATALWATVAVVSAVVAAEIGLRWLAPQEPPGMYTTDATLGFRLTPNYRGVQSFKGEGLPLEFNSWGMRDREFGDHLPGRRRILVLGDSFMFGHSVLVEQSLPKVLEGLLRRQLGEGAVEVINAGVPRYGTSQEWKWFEQIADKVRPDLVVLGMFVSNDIVDNLHFDRRQGEGAPQWRRQGWLNWLRLRSQLIIWWRHWRSTNSARPALLERRAFLTHAKEPTAETVEALRLTESYLKRLADSVAAKGAGFMVVLIPEAVQVYPEQWQRALQRLSLPAAEYEREQPSRHFADMAQRAGVPVLDLQPALDAHRGEELYLKLHWNSRGHAVAAQAVATFLLASPVLAKDP